MGFAIAFVRFRLWRPLEGKAPPFRRDESAWMRKEKGACGRRGKSM